VADCDGFFGQLWYFSANMATPLTRRVQPSLQFLFGQYVPRCKHRVDKQFDYHVLQYLDGGAVTLTIGADHFQMQGRWFWSSYPGPRIRFHAATPDLSWVHRYLAFRGPLLRRWQDEGLFPLRPQPLAADADYGERFDQLLQLALRSDRWGQSRAILLLELILTELAEARTRPQQAAAWLQPVLAQMQAMGAMTDQDHLAAEAGLPPRTFRRKFTAAVGVSPRQYQIDCRIDHAKQMLGATELPIKTIAQSLGYQDVSFFTRQFRQVTGVAPAAYRRSREGA